MSEDRVLDIQKRVIKELEYQLDIRKNQISESSTVESLGMDSLDMVEAIMMFEEVFDIHITDAEAEQLNTVVDVVQLVSRKK